MATRLKNTRSSPATRPPWLSDDEWTSVISKLHLTPQQTHLMSLLLRDFDYPAIADEMNISPTTVRTYLDRMKARSKVTTRLGLIIKAFEAARPGKVDGGNA